MGVAGEPKSVLFLSADLIGSTRFKQSENGWQKLFLTFYRNLPQYIAEETRKFPQEGHSEFRLWKAIGDELIFEVAVINEVQVSRAVRVWLSALTRYESEVLDKDNLALKGGAFIATFPGPDSESTIPRIPDIEDSDKDVVVLNDEALTGLRDNSKFLYDYFGPSIDTGFRVYGSASRRYFPMTIEVAWAMAHAAQTAKNNKAGEDLHNVDDFKFLHATSLKGVWGERPYPLFAIDREKDDKLHVALQVLDGTLPTASEIIDVCHACSESSDWLFRIYLPQSTNLAFQEIPKDAMQDLRDYATSADGAESEPGYTGQNPLAQNPPLGSISD